MPIEEIQRFRKQFPGAYDDLSDLDIALGLSRKNPQQFGNLPDLVRQSQQENRFFSPEHGGMVQFNIDPNAPGAEQLRKQRDELRKRAQEAGRQEFDFTGVPVPGPTPESLAAGRAEFDFGTPDLRRAPTLGEEAGAVGRQVAERTARNFQEGAEAFFNIPEAVRQLGRGEIASGALGLLGGVGGAFQQFTSPLLGAGETALRFGVGTSEQAARLGALGIEVATTAGLGLLAKAGRLTPFGEIINEIIGVGVRKPGTDAPKGIVEQTFDLDAERAANLRQSPAGGDPLRRQPAAQEGVAPPRGFDVEFPVPRGFEPEFPSDIGARAPARRSAEVFQQAESDINNFIKSVRERVQNKTGFNEEEIGVFQALREDPRLTERQQRFFDRVSKRFGPPEEPPAPRAAPPEPTPPTTKPPPLKRRRGGERLSDAEVAPSTFIMRKGGIKIPKDLREEFSGDLRRLHRSKGLAPDEMAQEAFEAGHIDNPTAAALIDWLKSGRRSAQGPGRVSDELGAILADINQQTDRGLLIRMAANPEDFVRGKSTQADIQNAAAARLKELGAKVDEPLGAQAVNAQEINGEVREFLEGQFGKKENYTPSEIEAATRIHKQAVEQGKLAVEPPRFEQTEAGQQGVLGGTPQRQVPTTARRAATAQQEGPTPLELAARGEDAGVQQALPSRFVDDGRIQSFIDAERPATLVDQGALSKFGEADLDAGIKLARAQGKVDAEAALQREFGRRMQGRRPDNPDPLDDLSRFEDEGNLLKELADDLTPKGGIGLGNFTGHGRSGSIAQDIKEFFATWGEAIPDFKNIELRKAVQNSLRRWTSAQELGNLHPEFKPAYEAFHKYPRAAANRHMEAMQPLVENPQGAPTYLTMRNARRQMEDRMLIHHRLNRQGLPRMTPAELAARGFNDDEVRIFNEVLDYGQKILKDYREFFVNRTLAARVAAGENPVVARADLEKRAAEAFRGLDHYVPLYRRGQKTVEVLDSQGGLKHFELLDSSFQRAAAVRRLRQRFPADQGFQVRKGILEEFAKSEAFDQIDLASLDILARAAKIDPRIAEEFLAGIKPKILERSQALARQIHARNIPGFKEDLREGLIDVGDKAYHYIERTLARDAATEALSKIDQTNQRELFEFTRRFIDEQSTPGIKWLQKVRNAAYFYWLAGNMKQFAVQLTQLPTVVYPRLTAFVNDVDATRFLSSGFKTAFGKFEKNTPEIQSMLEELFKRGVFQSRAEMFVGTIAERTPLRNPITAVPEFRLEAQVGQTIKSLRPHSKFQAFRDFMMVPITDADMRSRVASATAFYRAAREKLGMGVDEALNFAEREANRTSYLYGRGENPQMFGRGDIAGLFNMFRTWPANYFSFMRGQLNEKQYGVMARSAAAMLGLGGVLFNIPEAARKGIASVFEFDPEAEARAFFNGLWGEGRLTEGVLRGAPAAFGVDLSRSLSLGDIFPGDANLNVLGAPFAAAERVGRGVDTLVKAGLQEPFGPQARDAAELLSPAGLRNVFAGVRLADEGVRTGSGGKLNREDIPLGEVAGRVLGFPSTTETTIRANQRAFNIERAAHSRRQSESIERLARAIVDRDSEERSEVLKTIRDHNRDVRERGRPDLLIIINPTQLRQRVAEMRTPDAARRRTPRVLRRRQRELEDLFGTARPPEPPGQ